MKLLDLFAGIGGFSLAAHWMKWETVAFVEWAEFPQKVLAKNFPGVPIFGDIYKFDGLKFIEKYGSIDIICGGFPCQPFSTAGKRKGRNDDRHLWPEMLRIIRETQPAFVVGENVAGLISMDNGDLLEEILFDLESEGYEVQPFIIPAISVGAPHRRDRMWIVATNTGHPKQPGRRIKDNYKGSNKERKQKGYKPSSPNKQFITTNAEGEQTNPTPTGRLPTEPVNGSFDTADTEKTECQQSGGTRARREGFTDGPFNDWHSYGKGLEGYGESRERAGERIIGKTDWERHWYEAATKFCRMDNGIPGELDKLRTSDRTNRLKALGNSIVPQVAYEIFKAIDETYLK